MRTRISKTVIAVASVAALAAGSTMATASGDGSRQDSRSDRDSLKAIGLTANGKILVRFDTENPEDARRIGRVKGLKGDKRLRGIDYRVQDGKLYGVGDEGGIYTLNTQNTRASKVGRLSVDLEGRFFGVDFNPAADALRVISNTGQNLRQSFVTMPLGPTTVDGTLNNTGVTARGVNAAAYTNNDLDTNTATTLYDIDTRFDQVSIQAPANDGDLSPTGLLGVDAKANAGFDIYSTVRKGRTVDVEGYATLDTGSGYRSYEITLFTGEASDEGRFPFPVTDIAMPLNQR